MTNVCKPGSAKDLALQKYPKSICVRLARKRYIVMDRPYGGNKVGFGTSAELAWINAIGGTMEQMKALSTCRD